MWVILGILEYRFTILISNDLKEVNIDNTRKGFQVILICALEVSNNTLHLLIFLIIMNKLGIRKNKLVGICKYVHVCTIFFK